VDDQIFLREYKDFEELAYSVLNSLSQQNVKYVELFYSPGHFEEHGLNVCDITKSILNGAAIAEQEFQIKSNFIIDLIRMEGPETGMRWLDEATPFLNKGIIGIGLGGIEAGFPPQNYIKVYAEAKKEDFT